MFGQLNKQAVAKNSEFRVMLWQSKNSAGFLALFFFRVVISVERAVPRYDVEKVGIFIVRGVVVGCGWFLCVIYLPREN